MPNVYINGTKILDGTSSISASNPITLSWDGLEAVYSYMQYGTYIVISAINASNQFVKMSFTGNTGISNPITSYFDRYGDNSSYGSFAGYMQVGSSGSVSITFSEDIQGGKIRLNVNVSRQEVQRSEISLTTPYTKCGAPSNVHLSSISSTGANVTMSWNAGTAGTNNTITGYKIQRSADLGQAWTDLATTNAQTTSLSVAPPSVTYDKYLFRVCTMGSAGASFYSDYADCDDFLQRVPSLSPPTNFSISQATNSETISASWTAASGSGLDDPIIYAIYDGVHSNALWSGTATSATFNPSYYGTFTFTVYAYYGTLSDGSNSVQLTVAAASISISSFSITQAENSPALSLSWSATLSHASGTISYGVAQASTAIYSGQGTSCTYTPGSFSQLTYYVSATCGSLSANASQTFTRSAPSLRSKPTLTLSQSSGLATTASWTFGAYNYANGLSIQYHLYISFTKDITQAWYNEYIPSSGGYTVSGYSPTGTEPSKAYSEILTRELSLGDTVYFVVVPLFDSALYTPANSDWKSFTLMSDPIITAQPVLSLGSTSGASVAMSWTAAQVSYLDTGVIKYQYFVGPTNTYSDSYHIGTTTALSHTMTEAEIISKCGNGFGASSSGSKCYFFVRAYWEKDGRTGGWVTPTAVEFTYYPTINPPSNPSLSRSKGKDTAVSWTNQTAGNNSQPQAVLRIYRNGAWVNLATWISSAYTIAQSVWETYGKGTYTICVAHEWYGRYANGASLTFEFAPDNTIAVWNGSEWVHCAIYIWNGSAWVQCDPYVYRGGQWVLCSST